MENWMNQALDAGERAALLLKQMTTREKVGQLNQRLFGFRCFERQGEEIRLLPELMKEVEKWNGLGFLYGLQRADPWSARNYENGIDKSMAAAAANKVQQYVMEHSRLHIPVLLTEECPHGHQALDGYLLPVNLASGASFDPELVHRAFEVCGRQLAASGVHMGLVSMLDVARDPRWGRCEECFGEDPYLSARMAAAAVQGMHDGGVLVCAKHFAAQGECTGGTNASPARIGERELREIHLPPAASAVKAGADAIMAAYNEIDGIFCHINRKLLQNILRDEFGFDGIVMADGTALDQLELVTGSRLAAGAAALQAGVDVSLWDEAYTRLEEALEAGLIPTDTLDTSVWRVLRLKFAAGLFDHPFRGEQYHVFSSSGAGHNPVGEISTSDRSCSFALFPYEKYTESLELARASVVLLKNDGKLLPLRTDDMQTTDDRAAGRRIMRGSPSSTGDMQTTDQKTVRQGIAVIGPNADDCYALCGDYTPPLRPDQAVTVLQGMQNVFGENQIYYAPGCGLRRRSQHQLQEALETAASCTCTVLVLGSSSSRFGDISFLDTGAADQAAGEGAEITMDCGEGRDVSDLSLPQAQLELYRKVREASERLITVIISGRALVLSDIASSDAILQCFYPGPQGGRAIAEIICGRAVPTGALPVTLPASTGQIPVYYNYKRSGRFLSYTDGHNEPFAWFGSGLDYAEYSFTDITTEADSEGNVCVKCCVKNTSDKNGAALLQLYVRDIYASVVPRERQLKAFTKLWLLPGEEKNVLLRLGKDAFTMTGPEMKEIFEPGDFDLILENRGTEISRMRIRPSFEICEVLNSNKEKAEGVT